MSLVNYDITPYLDDASLATCYHVPNFETDEETEGTSTYSEGSPDHYLRQLTRRAEASPSIAQTPVLEVQQPVFESTEFGPPLETVSEDVSQAEPVRLPRPRKARARRAKSRHLAVELEPQHIALSVMKSRKLGTCELIETVPTEHREDVIECHSSLQNIVPFEVVVEDAAFKEVLARLEDSDDDRNDLTEVQEMVNKLPPQDIMECESTSVFLHRNVKKFLQLYSF